MIDLHSVWLPEIASLCRLIVNEDRLRTTWVEGIIETGIDSYDELYTAMVEDLDSTNMLKEVARIPAYAKVQGALTAFFEQFGVLDEWVEELDDEDPTVILASPGWKSLQAAARVALSAMEEAGISEDDWDPTGP